MMSPLPPDDEIFNPGGDAVHVYEPTSAAVDAWPVCGSLVPAMPVGCCPVTGRPRHPQWDKLSKAFLADNVTCLFCPCPSEVAHHIEPVHVRPDLELDRKNLAACCHICHFIIAHVRNYQKWLSPEVIMSLAHSFHRLFVKVRQGAMSNTPK